MGLPGGDLQKSQNVRANRWRDGESRTHPIPSAAEACARQGGAAIESEFFEVDERAGKRFFVAGRICGVQRKFLQPRSGNSIHPEPGSAPPEERFRGRISGTPPETQGGLRPEIRFWLDVCRPYGASYYGMNASHRCRGGLRCFVPGGTDRTWTMRYVSPQRSCG